MKTVEHRNKLPRETMLTLFYKDFKTQLDKVLSNVIYS